MTEATLSLAEPDLVLPLFGARDQHLRKVRDNFGVNITHRAGTIRISGDENSVAQATHVLEQMKSLVERQGTLTSDDVSKVVARASGDSEPVPQDEISVGTVARQIRPRTPGQSKYVRAIRDHELVFAIGPAGTGKTYLAVAMAVEALRNQLIRKVVLVRPAVEAGESLGYLPGDLQAKIHPYLRPLLDALHEMLDYDQVKRLMDQDVIEVIPLAYMRGRTLSHAFIILDEGQNTTVAQMKMFLTRMGEGSKIVVSGDTTQVDLPSNTRSGLIDALIRLKGIRGVSEVQMSKADIVRHRLVQEIVEAYDQSHVRGSSRTSQR